MNSENQFSVQIKSFDKKDGNDRSSSPNINEIPKFNKISLLESVRKKFRSTILNVNNDDGREFWMPDATSIDCFDCCSKFTTIRRRHHCRICGQIFCNDCCNEMIDSRLILPSSAPQPSPSASYSLAHGTSGKTRLIRVCRYCSNRLELIRNEQTKSGRKDGRKKSLVTTKRNSVSDLADGHRHHSMSMSKETVRFSKSNQRNKSDTIMIDSDRHLSHGKSLQSGRPPSSPSIIINNFDYGENLDDSTSMLSCSFDDVRTMLEELDATINAKEPAWVKEIVEEARSALNDEDKVNNNSPNIKITTDKNKEIKMICDKRDDRIDSLDRKSSKQLSHLDDRHDVLLKNETTFRLIKYEPSEEIRFSEIPKSILLRKDLIDLNSLLNSDGNNNDSNSSNENNEKIFERIFLKRKIEPNSDRSLIQFPINLDRSKFYSLVLNTIYDIHAEKILRQMLEDCRISNDWFEILNNMAKKIVDSIEPSTFTLSYSIEDYYQVSPVQNEQQSSVSLLSSNFGNNINNNSIPIDSIFSYPMDIRKRIKIKTIVNGSKNDCEIIDGFVFRKNVANRHMRSLIENPRILLFSCSIGYNQRRRHSSQQSQRILSTSKSNSCSNMRLTFFDSMRLQETDYVSNLVAKIVLLKPDIIFVSGNISRTTIELLQSKNITVINNVKQSILERIAFFTNAELIHSQEMILNTTRIGHCRRFRLQNFPLPITSLESDQNYPRLLNFRTKTLMFLEGCVEGIGCSILLRGSSSLNDLKKLKSILHYIIFVYYNNRLERAFHENVKCLPIEQKYDCTTLASYYRQLFPSETKQFDDRIDENMIISPNGSSLSREEDKSCDKLSKMTIINDFSDPLRSAQLEEDDGQNNDDIRKKQTFLFQIKTVSKNFSSLLDSIQLSSSPSIRYALPFLMKEDILEISALRFHFPICLLESDRLDQKLGLSSSSIDYSGPKSRFCDSNQSDPDHSKHLIHPFMINEDYDSQEHLDELIADFRASGPFRRPPRPISVPNEKGSSSTILDRKLNRSNGNRIEPLSNQAQQNIFILFSLFSLQSDNSFLFCEKPKIIEIDYYGKNDMSLGSFLVRHFFIDYCPTFSSSSSTNQSFRKGFCPNESCNITMFKHLMRFTHHNGSLTVYLNELTQSRSLENHNGTGSKILTWTFCVRCQKISDYCETSNESLSLSFGKFLELKFYGENFFDFRKYFDLDNCDDSKERIIENQTDDDLRSQKCRHSSHQENYQFFSYDRLVVIFKYEPIDIYEIMTPARVIPLTKNHFSKTKMIDSLKLLTEQCYEVFGNVHNELQRIQTLASGGEGIIDAPGTVVQLQQQLSNVEGPSINLGKIDELQNHLRKEKCNFDSLIKEMHFELSKSDLTISADVLKLYNLDNNLVYIRKFIAELVLKWNERMKEFLQEIQSNKKRGPDSNKFITSIVNRFLSNDSTNESKSDPKNSEQTEQSSSDLQSAQMKENSSSARETTGISDSMADSWENKKQASSIKNKIISKVTDGSLNESNATVASALTTTSSSTLFSTKLFTRNNNDEIQIVFEMPFDLNDNQDSQLATPASSSSSTSAQFNHYQLPSYRDISIIVRGSDPGSIIAYALTLPEYETKLSKIQTNSCSTPSMYSASETSIKSDQINNSTMAASTAASSSSLFSLVSTATLLATNPSVTGNESNSEPNGKDGVTIQKHTSVPASTTATNSASIAAPVIDGTTGEELNNHIDIQFNDTNGKFYCCIYFAELFRKFRSQILLGGNDSVRQTIRDHLNHYRDDCLEHQQQQQKNNDSVDASGSSSFNHNNNNSLGKIAEDLYIHSLSQCLPWNAIGGKSGSTFMKTLDQRFILKEVSKGELKHFLTFVCDYINYCQRASRLNRLTTFVKVVGVYQIIYKNVNNKGSIHYILVMENLFYDCNISFIYDLKGSMRNRKIDIDSTFYSNNLRNNSNSNSVVGSAINLNDTTDESLSKLLNDEKGISVGIANGSASTTATARFSNKSSNSNRSNVTSNGRINPTSTVLLDENLRQISIAYPLYVHSHSKKSLMEAIHRDSEFLRIHDVMDYSLLVGLDDETQEFVVGIIDYVRLFNWEKILESHVKKIANAIDPTVVHPSVYQKRFLAAINDYFTEVPDKWYPFLRLNSKSIDSSIFRPQLKHQQSSSNNLHGKISDCDKIEDYQNDNHRMGNKNTLNNRSFGV